MDLRCLLALLVIGCSSSSTSGNRASTGGAPNSDSDSGTYTGDNSTCPAWPREKLFPIVGPLFYGPDVGPCSVEETDRPSVPNPKVFTMFYTYNGDGRPTQAKTPLDTTLIHQLDYTYAEGLVSKATEFNEGLQSQVTYSYADQLASYLVVDASGTNYQYDYRLDDNGYPTTIDVGVYVNGQLTTSDGATRFVFKYDKCKIVERTAYTASGDWVPESTATFSYDDAGHVTNINTAERLLAYDYSCWAPPDAGTDDAGS